MDLRITAVRLRFKFQKLQLVDGNVETKMYAQRAYVLKARGEIDALAELL